jgi:putrescine transport system ATP-binding protein
VAQAAAPAEVYEQPNSRWVADFIGEVTLIAGRVSEKGLMQSTLGPLRIDAGGYVGAERWLALRPEKLRMSAEKPDAGAGNTLSGTVAEIGYRGDVSLYKVRLADRSLMKVAVANSAGRPPVAVNDLVWVSWPPEAGVLLSE